MKHCNLKTTLIVLFIISLLGIFAQPANAAGICLSAHHEGPINHIVFTLTGTGVNFGDGSSDPGANGSTWHDYAYNPGGIKSYTASSGECTTTVTIDDRPAGSGNSSSPTSTGTTVVGCIVRGAKGPGIRGWIDGAGGLHPDGYNVDFNQHDAKGWYATVLFTMDYVNKGGGAHYTKDSKGRIETFSITPFNGGYQCKWYPIKKK